MAYFDLIGNAWYAPMRAVEAEVPKEPLFAEFLWDAERMCLLPDVLIDDSRAGEGIIAVSSNIALGPHWRTAPATRTLRCRNGHEVSQRLGELAARTIRGIIADKEPLAPPFLTVDEPTQPGSPAGIPGLTFLLGGWGIVCCTEISAFPGRHEQAMCYKRAWLELYAHPSGDAVVMGARSTPKAPNFIHEILFPRGTMARRRHVLVQRQTLPPEYYAATDEPDAAPRRDLTIAFFSETEASLWEDFTHAALNGTEIADKDVRLAGARAAAAAMAEEAAGEHPPLSSFLKRKGDPEAAPPAAPAPVVG